MPSKGPLGLRSSRSAGILVLPILAIGSWSFAALLCGVGCGLDVMASGAGPADGSVASLNDARAVSDAPAAADDAHAVDLDGGNAVDAPTEASSCGAVLSSPTNCGQCGHSCLGGACTAGKCQPVVLATDSALGAVALDATTAYYVAENAGIIRKVPLAGGASVDLFSTGRAPHDLAVDGDRLFWTDQVGAGSYVLTTSTPTKLGGGAARAVSPTASGPYFITATTVELWDRGLTTQVSTLNNNASSPAIVTDATYAYWSAGQQIRRVVFASTTVTNVVTGLAASPTSMAISATHVYWTTATSVQRAPIGTAAGWVVATITAGETAAASIAVDATNAYWLDLTTGALRRAPVGGGAAETLATFSKQLVDAPYPHQIALTSDAVYVASTSDGTLSRIAK
jgi:hypothetical protein